MTWDENGRRKGLPMSRCKLCKTITDRGKTYCYGYTNFGSPTERSEYCKTCMFHVRNIKD